jgi:hypothetical protein
VATGHADAEVREVLGEGVVAGIRGDRDTDFVDAFGRTQAVDGMGDNGLARKVSEHFIGEARAGQAGLDDDDFTHGLVSLRSFVANGKRVRRTRRRGEVKVKEAGT